MKGWTFKIQEIEPEQTVLHQVYDLLTEMIVQDAQTKDSTESQETVEAKEIQKGKTA